MTAQHISYDFDVIASDTTSIKRPVYFTKTSPRSALSRVVLEIREILSERVSSGGLTAMNPQAAADQVDGGHASGGGVPSVLYDMELLREFDAFIIEVYSTFMRENARASYAGWIAWGYARRPLKPYTAQQLAPMFDVAPATIKKHLVEIDQVVEDCMAKRQWRLG